MLTLIRAEDFRKTLQRRPVELDELLRGVVEQVRPFVTARRLQLNVQMADDLGTFEIDADKIGAVADQPADQRDQVHARRRRDRAEGSA